MYVHCVVRKLFGKKGKSCGVGSRYLALRSRRVNVPSRTRESKKSQWVKWEAKDWGGSEVETIYETVVGEGRSMLR